MICTILRALREQRGISQLELACELGVSQEAISKWERGRAEPKIQNLRMLADFYSVSVDYIVGYRPESMTTEMENLLRRLSRKQIAVLYDMAVKMVEEQ